MILLRDYVSKYIAQSNVSVLDVGCGNGNIVIDELQQRFSKKIGVDITPDQTLKNTSMNQIYYGELSSIKLEEKFDLIIALWVLEHVENPTEFFVKLNDLLNEGGRFAFVTPYKYSYLIIFRRLLNQKLANTLVNKLYGRTSKAIFPVRYFSNSIKDLTELAKRSGFRIDKLVVNFDPSYTSFNRASFLLNRLLYKTGGNIFKSHIVGIFHKPQNPTGSRSRG